MTDRPALTPLADPNRTMPHSALEQRHVIDSALASLEREESRLERLGFEWPLARCREQRRFWEFVGALHAMAEGEPGARGRT